jgi:hypothetical protein
MNKSLPWSVELIERFEDKWNWYYLSENKSLPWSVELIERFEDKWEWNYLAHEALYQKVIAPHFSDQLIHDFFAE